MSVRPQRGGDAHSRDGVEVSGFHSPNASIAAIGIDRLGAVTGHSTRMPNSTAHGPKATFDDPALTRHLAPKQTPSGGQDEHRELTVFSFASSSASCSYGLSEVCLGLAVHRR